MVRAYFMRLLIWRMGRLDGTASEVDFEILRTLSLRLHQVWCNFLYVEEDARRNSSVAPTTVPCSPAPSRCLLIIRDEAPTPPMFLSFDSILPASQQHGLQRFNHRDSTFLSSPPPLARKTDQSERTGSGGKRRWEILKSIIPFTNSSARQPPGSPEAPKSLNVNGNTPASLPNRPNPNSPGSEASTSKASEETTEYRTHSFKFSLEWLERGQLPNKDQRLHPPNLPLPAELYLQLEDFHRPGDIPSKPQGTAVGESKYAGRALAEWALLIAECHNFFDRRKQEGVPENSKVETPALCVQPFRKP